MGYGRWAVSHALWAVSYRLWDPGKTEECGITRRQIALKPKNFKTDG
jgi:hypothetical protein